MNTIVGGVAYEVDVDDREFVRRLREAARRGERALSGIGDEAEEVGRELRQAGRQGQTAFRQMETSARRAERAFENSNDSLNRIRNTVSGLALGAGFAVATRVVADYAQAISTLQGVTGANRCADRSVGGDR